MLRTNSKKFRANLMQYINDYMESVFDDRGITAKSDSETCKNIYTIFMDEFGNNEIKRFKLSRKYWNIYNIFEDYSRGLPLNGLFCYWYNRMALDDIASLKEMTEEEKARYQKRHNEDECGKILTSYIFNEIMKQKNKASDN